MNYSEFMRLWCVVGFSTGTTFTSVSCVFDYYSFVALGSILTIVVFYFLILFCSFIFSMILLERSLPEGDKNRLF